MFSVTMYLISINVNDKDSAWMNETRNLQKNIFRMEDLKVTLFVSKIS